MKYVKIPKPNVKSNAEVQKVGVSIGPLGYGNLKSSLTKIIEAFKLKDWKEYENKNSFAKAKYD